MGDVPIFIGKNGRVVDLSKNNETGTDTDDNEDGDIDEVSGSGSSGLPTTTPVFTKMTPTTPVKQEIRSPDKGGADVPLIVAAVCGGIVLIVIVILLVCWRRRKRRRRLEKSMSTKPLPHPSSMDNSESSRATLPVRPAGGGGEGYYSTAVPLMAAFPPSPNGDDLPPPIEPPPPPPMAKNSPGHSSGKPGKSTGGSYNAARYTKLKCAEGGATASAPDEEESIYETIDDSDETPPDNVSVYLLASETSPQRGVKGETSSQKGGKGETSPQKGGKGNFSPQNGGQGDDADEYLLTPVERKSLKKGGGGDDSADESVGTKC